MTLQHKVEALLFSSGKAMSEEQLAEILKETPHNIKNALEALKESYNQQEGALKIFNESSNWKMLIRDEFVALAQSIVADTELSKPTLETLAVVAHNHPKILQSKIIDVRGSNAYEHIKELLDLSFITKTPEGRSFNIKLTEKFFEYFDVEGAKSIQELFKEVPVPEKQEALAPAPVPQEKEVPPKPTLTVERDHDEENKFINQWEEKLETVKERNDELDKDELFTKPVPELEETTSEEEQDASPEQEEGEESHDEGREHNL